MRRFIHRLQQKIDFLFFNERFKILRKYGTLIMFFVRKQKMTYLTLI